MKLRTRIASWDGKPSSTALDVCSDWLAQKPSGNLCLRDVTLCISDLEVNVTASMFALPSSSEIHVILDCASSSVSKIRPDPPRWAGCLPSGQRLCSFSAVLSFIPFLLSSFVHSFTDLEFCNSILGINTFTMRFIIHSLLALATVLPTLAFTNGSLIPSYFCNPKPDGLPKSLGELIPFTVKDQNTALAFNTNGGRYPSYCNISC